MPVGSVTFDGVNKLFGDVHAVKDLQFGIEAGEFLVLVGPSGCGKTTALRMIAGLEEPTSGRISIDGQDVTTTEPKKRDIAMVFQSYALYPHMTVRDNLAFGLRQRRTPRDEIGRRVDEAARMLDIGHLLERRPRELSGGQRQRVALGRAIVRRPKVFLMDEPLSNLDAQLRVRTRAEIIGLHRQLDTTVIYVTHDQVEAMTMGTRIAVMKDGVLQQLARPTDLYTQPANTFVATFIGSPAMNLIPGSLASSGGRVDFVSESLTLPIPPGLAPTRMDGPVLLGLRPEGFSRRPVGEPVSGTLTGIVDLVEPHGSDVFVTVRAGDERITARLDPDIDVRLQTPITLKPAGDSMHLFDGNSGLALAHGKGPCQTAP